jgi:hypothetical protein
MMCDWPNPLSERLQGKQTFLWLLGTFVVWLACDLSEMLGVPVDNTEVPSPVKGGV